MKKLLLTSLFGSLALFQAPGAIVISQYYEGPSTNKWIELYNTDTVNAFDLSTLTIGHWNNANAEGYKSNTAANFTLALSGTILPGAYFLLGNTGNTTPNYVTANLNNNSVINFNGNDSIAIYTGAFATANIVDAIGFTNAGNEGIDRSFVRADNTVAGWNTTAGSNATSFPAVWTQFTNAQVDSAAVGTPERLVAAVPEPSTALTLFGGISVLVGFRRLRRGAGNGRPSAGSL